MRSQVIQAGVGAITWIKDRQTVLAIAIVAIAIVSACVLLDMADSRQKVKVNAAKTAQRALVGAIAREQASALSYDLDKAVWKAQLEWSAILEEHCKGCGDDFFPPYGEGQFELIDKFNREYSRAVRADHDQLRILALYFSVPTWINEDAKAPLSIGKLSEPALSAVGAWTELERVRTVLGLPRP